MFELLRQINFLEFNQQVHHENEFSNEVSNEFVNDYNEIAGESFDNYFKTSECFINSDKLLSEPVDMKNSFCNEQETAKVSFIDKLSHFQPKETHFSDEVVGEHSQCGNVDWFSYPTSFFQDDFTLKSLNEIYSDKFSHGAKSVKKVPIGNDFCIKSNKSEATNVDNYISSRFANEDLPKDQFQRNFQPQILPTKHKYDKDVFLSLIKKRTIISTNSKVLKSNDIKFSEDPAKYHQTPESFSHPSNSDQTFSYNTDVHSKYMVEVVHHNLADYFRKAGVNFSMKNNCKGGFNTVVQKSISLNDLRPKNNLYHILYSHLVEIINHVNSKSMLKRKVIIYYEYLKAFRFL